MLVQPTARWTLDTMTTRSAVISTIALIVLLMGGIAIAAVMRDGEIPERAGGIVTTVLAGFATVLAGLLLFLRMDTVNSKVDRVHHDVLNGPMRENMRKAISEDRHEQRSRDTVTINRSELETLKRRAGERTGGKGEGGT